MEEYFLGLNSQTTCIIQPLAGLWSDMAEALYPLQFVVELYFLVIRGNCQLSMFDTACSSLWNTYPKTKQTEYVATRLIKKVKLDFEKKSDILCRLFIY